MTLEDHICLIIDNDRQLLAGMLSLARSRRNVGSLRRALEVAITDKVEPEISELDIGPSQMLAQVLANSALARVDWHEIACHYKTKVRDGVTV